MAPPVVAAPPLPSGQWVYTGQYGWLWMPYGQPYTQVVPDAAVGYMFVFYPRFGWRWVVAPWVLGFGVEPFWGPSGPIYFEWFAHPWFRVGTSYHPYHGWRYAPHAHRHYPDAR